MRAEPRVGRPSIARGPAPPSPPGEGDGPLAWFEHWLRRQPEAPAVESEAGAWTYRALDELARSAAGDLRRSAGERHLVGVCLDRSASQVALALALARLGAAYLPLGPRPAGDRLRAALAAPGLAALVTGGDLEPPAGWSALAPTLPGDVPAELLLPPEPAPAATVAPGGEPPLYVVLTSGSTGRAKAVAVGSASLANLLRWYCARCDLRPGARVSLLIGTSFDPHLMEMWAALCSGATLCVAPAGVQSSPAALVDWLRARRVTACILPTPLAELVFELDWPSDLALEHLVVGGDRLRRWPPPIGRARVHNMYGPAEATVVTTAHELLPGAAAGAGPVPIGRPISGVEVRVADEEGRTVTIGEAGELLVGGAGLALGYLDPEQTASRFVRLAGPLEARVYRTGDRALMRPDGVLEFLGRLDDQVKVSGVRVEPGEVEAALERAPDVRQAIAVPVRTPAGDARLVAFVRLAPGAADIPPGLLDSLRASLPEAAVPAAVHVLSEVPLTSTGKVDRAALAAMASERPTTAGDLARTAGGTLDVLVGACREVLVESDVTPATNFLDAGGDSMAAARLLVRIEEVWGVRLRAAEVLRQPDLAALADLIDRRRPA